MPTKTAEKPPTRSSPQPAGPARAAPFGLGLVLLIVAVGTALVLSIEHLGGIKLPGCGPGSPCAKAAASVWGKVPGTSWPMSFVGLAFFAALLASWAVSRGAVGSQLRLIVRLGACVSLLYLIVIFAGDYHCWYCLAAHVVNLLFWLVVERAPLARAAAATLPLTGGAFAVVSIILGVVQLQAKEAMLAKSERDLSRSTADIIAKTEQQGGAKAPADDIPRPWKGGFTGRYRLGPERAAIRLVILSDYQCVDCKAIETQVQRILASRKDVSLSIKHFPMCAACNPHFANNNMHPNACWAARAAEAAGLLGGSEGYFKMHDWLFEHGGAFTDAELTAGLQSLGFDRDVFVGLMTGEQTLKNVQSDIEEGIWLGLHYTPMIFINGVELVGVFAPEALIRAVDAVAAKSPSPLTAEHDQPPPASEKYVNDWREQPITRPPPDQHPRIVGADTGKVRITVWGDYQEPNSARLDGQIRGLMRGRSDISYNFRHFPVDQSCSPHTQRTANPKACRAHAAAEAAAKLGGTDAYWKMHEWLMAHQADFSDETLRAAAAQMGLDADALFAVMDDATIRQVILEDAAAGTLVGLRAVPWPIINDRFVPRFEKPGSNVLERIINEAAGQ